MAFADPGAGRSVNAGTPAGSRVRLTLLAACVKGDILGYAGGWTPALATVGTAIQGRFVALHDAAAAAEVEASPDALVWGYTGATPNGDVYVAEGAAANAGQVTQTAPSTSGDVNTIIGVAVNATTVKYHLNARAGTTA